ncbi:hypothetical protein H310_10838 [Aphanomyces invadans]|uniref:Phosphatidylserine synthase n=1 Tax=Aphanomyces invadans TaxID=157072 RepID=A0A024TQZ5_9STRA|nr:hypothetical protein H310_10838 [Aphanomyces invadans]ETV95782.1 hypothetical protein H310_10838 [Aphanomyces invadans]|eukprot:XP_008875533.1 hypothetical protein H310_10838 [Aphanomyces invadans]
MATESDSLAETATPAIQLGKTADPAVYGDLDVSVPQTPADDDSWTTRPHTLLVGLITLVYFLYALLHEDPASTSLDDLKRGVKFACIFFLVYCVLQLRDGHFIRPHPAIWRLITGIFILYEMVLILLLFMKTPDARAFLKHYDPSLGVQLPEEGFAEDCRLFTPEHPTNAVANFSATLFDRFVVMHFLGWIVGAVMIRSYTVCWLISILFEFYELSFAHWLKNFAECWWDQIILDVLLCNAAGIWIGMRICRYFEMKKYNWVGWRKIPTVSGRAQRFAAQFTPANWLPYDWKMFRSATRFWMVLFMVVVLSVMMLNSFFLKTVLWVPASNSLNVVRLTIWYSAGSYAIAEFYVFMSYTAPSHLPDGATAPSRKLGPRAWLGLGVVVTEICLILKHGQGMFTAPFPTIVKVSWAIASVLVFGGSTVYFTIVHRNRRALAAAHAKKTN